MEESPPYERIKLSKALTSTAEGLRLRPQQFYDDAEIEVRTSSQVVNINPDQKEVELSDGQMIGFTKLVIASGCMAKKLDCPGADLKNVFALRTPTDANSIAATAGQDKDVVVLGTSFIAMEVRWEKRTFSVIRFNQFLASDCCILCQQGQRRDRGWQKSSVREIAWRRNRAIFQATLRKEGGPIQARHINFGDQRVPFKCWPDWQCIARRWIRSDCRCAGLRHRRGAKHRLS